MYSLQRIARAPPTIAAGWRRRPGRTGDRPARRTPSRPATVALRDRTPCSVRGHRDDRAPASAPGRVAPGPPRHWQRAPAESSSPAGLPRAGAPAPRSRPHAHPAVASTGATCARWWPPAGVFDRVPWSCARRPRWQSTASPAVAPAGRNAPLAARSRQRPRGGEFRLPRAGRHRAVRFPGARSARSSPARAPTTCHAKLLRLPAIRVERRRGERRRVVRCSEDTACRALSLFPLRLHDLQVPCAGARLSSRRHCQ